uniref:O-fucosyltransferase family protein n=1 Tax=Brassica oleracea var. oleracea TaxID=109376 RepID=A0A0D3C9S3_BRAOL
MEHERPDVERPESRDLLLPVCGVPPAYSPLLSPTRFFPLSGEPSPRQTIKRGKKNRLIRTWYEQRTATTAIGVIVILGVFFLVNWLMLSRLHEGRVWLRKGFAKNTYQIPKWVSSTQNVEVRRFGKSKRKHNGTYDRMLDLAAQALLENKREPKELWQEPKAQALAWKPCADQRSWSPDDGENGYIMVTANGGINQQRVAVCNIVVVARLLNASLVIPKFMLSDVWTDASQFGDIYQEEHFIKYLSPDIRIVKELPKELRSLDLEAIGSVHFISFKVTDVDVMKEAKPDFYMKHILPILHKNKVIHFVGFSNRLAFDPMPFDLQRLRCRCNFHALNFVPRIQETGALIVKRLRNSSGSYLAPLDVHLLGPKSASSLILHNKSDPPARKKASSSISSKYLALHLRFEIDMVAHSLCYFGGGEREQKELDSYRQKHFPSLSTLTKTKKFPSPDALRTEGLCPLTPEEAVLMLVALGFNRETRVFVAGAHIYGGNKRLAALTSLYPNLVTKEKLLSPSELQPFKNFSSQLAALDFIGCAAANAFAMTDSGSQLSSLVSGYRIYYGGGKMPTIRPNKRRLSDILLKNNTIAWNVFEKRVRKAIRQTKHVFARPTGRSVYRYPRCKECMCNDQ